MKPMNDDAAHELERDRVVSSDDDLLICVNPDDEVIGYERKDRCHKGEGLLHRAFSIFLFNDAGELLLQERDISKLLWPSTWSNTCCSHPRKGQSIEEAAGIRLRDELNCEARLQKVYTFRYHASYQDRGSENEMCTVLIGHLNHTPNYNRNEVSRMKWTSAQELEGELIAKPMDYTPWFRMEFQELRTSFWPQIEKVIAQGKGNS